MKSILTAILLAFSYAAQAAPALHSEHAVVFDATNQEVLLEKNANTPAPIASITKVMTAMVALDARPNLNEPLKVSHEDVDTLKNSSSRVAVGTELTREEMLHLALMSSENRAAHALSRYYPGGEDAFVNAMNRKARSLGMTSTQLADPTGLSPANHASAHDLVRMVLAAERYEPITQYSTTSSAQMPIGSRVLSYKNSNPLVGKPNWNIELSKTGYTREAGRCIVMKMAAAGKKLVVVLLGSQTPSARLADIQAIKRWVTGEQAPVVARAKKRGSDTVLAKKGGLRMASLAEKPRSRTKASAVMVSKRDSKSFASGKGEKVIRMVKADSKMAKPSAKPVRQVKHVQTKMVSKAKRT